MSDKLQWVFELFDRFSTPAAKIGDQLKVVNDRLGEARSAFHSTSGYLSEMGTRAGATALQALGLGAAITPIGAAAGLAASAVETMATAVAGLEVSLLAGGAALAKYGIEQAAFKETSLASLKTILNSEGAASDVFRRSVKFAALTPLETKPVVQSMSRLFSAGFNQKQSETLLAFVSDVTSLSGGGAETQNRLIRAFSVIRGRGKIDATHLNEIMTDAGSAGVTVGAVIDQIAKARKVSHDAADKLLHSGAIKADEGIMAVLNAYRAQEGMKGHDIGHASIEQSHTISGLLSTLASRPSEIFLTFDKLGELPGLKKFKSALENITDALDTTKGAGMEFAQAVLGVFSDELTGVFEDFGDPAKGPALMANILRDAVVVVKDLGAALQVSMGFGKGLAGGIAEGLGLGKDLMSGPLDPEKIKGLTETFTKLGHAIGEAVAKLVEMVKPITTILDSKAAVGDRLGAVGSLAKGAYQNLTPEGLLSKMLPEQGILGRLHDLGAQSNLEALAQSQAANPVSRPEDRSDVRSNTNHVTVHLALNARSDDPADLARQVAEELPDAIPMALDTSSVPGVP